MFASDNDSLKLRLALLESLTLGEIQQSQQPEVASLTRYSTSNQTTLLLRSHTAQTQFLQSIEKYKPIVQFVEDYKNNKPFLQPSDLLVGGDNVGGNIEVAKDSVTGGNGKGDEEENGATSLLSIQSIISLLLESESDLKQLERDLRTCETYQERNVAGAGKLSDHEALLPRLQTLREQANERLRDDTNVEGRAMQLMERYSNQIDAISQLFISWDQVLTQTEDALTQLERKTL